MAEVGRVLKPGGIVDVTAEGKSRLFEHNAHKPYLMITYFRHHLPDSPTFVDCASKCGASRLAYGWNVWRASSGPYSSLGGHC